MWIITNSAWGFWLLYTQLTSKKDWDSETLMLTTCSLCSFHYIINVIPYILNPIILGIKSKYEGGKHIFLFIKITVVTFFAKAGIGLSLWVTTIRKSADTDKPNWEDTIYYGNMSLVKEVGVGNRIFAFMMHHFHNH